jgi:hypothetical protein
LKDTIMPAAQAGDVVIVDPDYCMRVEEQIRTGTAPVQALEQPESLPRKTWPQVDFKREAFKPDWSADFDRDSLMGLKDKFFREYFDKAGKSNTINTDAHNIFGFGANGQQLHLKHNKDAPAFEFDLPNNVGDLKVTDFRAKDLAPVLDHLPDAPIMGPVTVQANNHAMVISYDADVGKVEIAIPTVKEWEVAEGERLFYALGRA